MEFFQPVIIKICFLNSQAESRIQILEKAVSEAQTSESRVSDLQHWIFRVDELLSDFIENDTTVECLPAEFQVYFFYYLFWSYFYC